MPVEESEGEGTNRTDRAETEQDATDNSMPARHEPDAPGIPPPEPPAHKQTTHVRKKRMPRIDVGVSAQLILAVFQSLLFAATIWQAIIAQGAANDGHIAAQAAQEAADIAQTSLELTQRAVLVVSPNATQDLNSRHVYLAAQDRGSAPAINIRGSSAVSYTNKADFDVEPVYNSESLLSGHLADELDQFYNGTIHFEMPQAMISRISSALDGQRVLLRVNGLISYNDLLKRSHKVFFCTVYAGSNRLLFSKLDDCDHPNSY